MTAKTALVVDDEPEIRAVITDYLTDQGFVVTEAENGLEALVEVRRVRPSVVILDLMMPRLGGIEALASIRRELPEVNVIVVTGTPDDTLRGRAVALGAAALLSKPLDLAMLGAIIASVTTHAIDERPAPAAKRGGSPPPPGRAPSPSVLVVDDDEEVVVVLDEYLRALGYRTVLARDAVSALRTIIDDRPDVVLLDLVLPRLGGVEALTAIRGIAPSTRVIVMSGTSNADLARQALSYGAFDYLRKPFDMAYLKQSVEAAVKARREDGG